MVMLTATLALILRSFAGVLLKRWIVLNWTRDCARLYAVAEC